MFFDNSDPCWIPAVPIGVDQEYRLRKAQFGDGYEQRILDGINALDLRFNVNFPNRPSQIILDMDAYLTAMKAAGFPFTDPVSELVFTVFCDKWQISWDVKRRKDPLTLKYIYYGSLTAEFYRGNGVQIGPLP